MTDLVVRSVLDLTDPSVTVGKHSAWVSGVKTKVPFQWSGRCCKYRHPCEASYDRATIAEEVAMFRWLHAQGYAPPIGKTVFYRTVKSQHLGYEWHDPLGAYGFVMEDVDELPPGPVTPTVVEEIRAGGMIVGSNGAWSDLLVPERQNIRNGYVIDLRRSGFDMLRFQGEIPPLPEYCEDTVALRERLHREGQFPFGKRTQAYQEFRLDREWHKAEREVVKRAEIIGFDPKPGESVVDIGCCVGGFLQYAALRQAQKTPWICSCPDSKGCQPIAPMTPIGPLVGIDGQPEFIDLARALARANDWNICYRLSDLRYDMDTANWIRTVFPNGVDHLLCLSMGKHLGEQTMWWYVDHLNARRTYLETNAVNSGEYPWADEVKRRGGCYVGDTHDRNTRRAYVIERHSR